MPEANYLALKKVPYLGTKATVYNMRSTGRAASLDRDRRHGWRRQDSARLVRNANVPDAPQLDTQHAGTLVRSMGVDHKNIG